ncbi:hypothetical protein [Pseudolysinimonas kribbensis]|uniref:Uncharacterized protein n=1 Tax=Pseudolysinimonas kribbensis TaxID=433641 RepID=A0ABQ6K2X8_9MICO|nr:hypothetical protein [Pseudolysinimonas kribbensis]GMA94980.1 hypothetical protein GCM10025881_18040 [Pseudolysinimonas kribbensis]
MVGVLCAAGAIAAVSTAVAVLDSSGMFSAVNGQPSEMDRRFAVAQAGYAILALAPPLAGGFLVAGIAILALLARRWRTEHPEPLTRARAR